MKYCPVCSAQYDEDVIRFCTKDGTPLLDEAQPNFTQIPSETVEDDDFGQETIIRRKPIVADDQPIAYDSQGQSERIVIPTSEPQTSTVRPRAAQGFVVPPPPPNTARTVFLTIIGTLFVLGLGVGIFWLLKKDTPANTNLNINSNQNTNLNTNLGFDSNFNFNTNFNTNSNINSNLNLNSNFNMNVNANANTKPSPTPSPKPSPTPSPVRSPTPEPSDSPSPTNTRPPVNTQPTPLGTPRTGPRPPPITNRPPGNANGLR
ncbi:MAG: hypothetical protein QM785_03450 [Pyrinomonadaceae bacterium]